MLKPTEDRVPKPGAVFHLYRDLWRLLRGERVTPTPEYLKQNARLVAPTPEDPENNYPLY